MLTDRSQQCRIGFEQVFVEVLRSRLPRSKNKLSGKPRAINDCACNLISVHTFRFALSEFGLSDVRSLLRRRPDLVGTIGTHTIEAKFAAPSHLLLVVYAGVDDLQTMLAGAFDVQNVSPSRPPIIFPLSLRAKTQSGE